MIPAPFGARTSGKDGRAERTNMKLKEYAVDTFLYGGVEKEEYQSVGPVVCRKNRETLTLASAMCGVMFAALTVASFFSDTIMDALIYYGIMTVACTVLFILSLTAARLRLRMVLPMWYLLYLFFGTYAVLLNTVIRPQLSATTLCAFLVAAPLLIIDRPWRVTAFMMALSAIFVGCAYQFKTRYLAFADSVNVYCCLFIGAAIYTRLVRVKLREILQARLLERQRDTDKLTGLLNKAAVEQQICALLSLPRQQGTLVIIDIDNFKHINDTYGHAFGDVVLRRTADCIRAVFPGNNLCGRFGGDEFLLFLPGQVDDVAGQMDRMIELLKKEIEYPSPQDSFSISAGTAVAPRDGQNYQTLFQKADQALYTAKRAGKNCWISYSDQSAKES